MRVMTTIGNLLPRLLISTALITSAAEMPRLVNKNGHFEFDVEGRPYLILGAQIHNSSAWPSVLPKVWPALEAMHANTAAAPVYWEQMEPEPGKFDFGNVDVLVKQAREHNLHLVLLWFGTWKNGNMHYVPTWVKTDTARFPRMVNAHGEPLDVLSAHAPANLNADKNAFAHLMRHLKELDGDIHTVLMMQVENESGAIGTVRDFSPVAERQFQSAVPAEMKTVGKSASGTWRQVFGGEADEYFQAYYQARYVNAVAEAGKAEFPLPMYVNVWLAYPVAQLPERQYAIPGQGYPSGGPIQKMIAFWKMNAPALDMIGPDIYSDSSDFVLDTMRIYHRHDNPLWIPEIGFGDSYAKYFFSAIGMGAIGFSPFGVDRAGGRSANNEEPTMHAQNYQLFAPAAREVARLIAEGRVKTAVEEIGQARQEIDFGDWRAQVSFGFPQRDGMPPPGTKDAHGRAMVAQLGPDEFLVTGFDASVAFHIPGRLPGLRMQILRAEEGQFEDDGSGRNVWKPLRLWNGDETDRGLNFRQQPTWVRLQVGRF
ncbi:MAG: DUF5597 domain-containing protein [Bryobacteraceae bacterium]